jgi:hypothetical protein
VIPVLIFGDATRHEWLFEGPQGIPNVLWFRYFDPEDDQVGGKNHRFVRFAGAHELMVVASWLHGFSGNLTKMPVWDFNPARKEGRGLTEDERDLVVDKLKSVGRDLLAKENPWQPLVVCLDDVVDWWHGLVLGSRDLDPEVQTALRERRAGESLFWTTQVTRLVMIAGERDHIVQGEVIGVQPNVPPIVERAAGLTIWVHQGEGTVYASRRSDMQAGAALVPAYIQSLVGLPSTARALQEDV